MLALVDCNNFFVSCQRVFEPHLENRPVVVLSNNDGCIISRSQEAKDLGIKMGEPLFMAKKVIEQENVAVFSSNFMLYGDMSKRVMAVLRQFGAVEQYSVDEAFVNLEKVPTAHLQEYGSIIRATIKKYLGLPVCVGIAPTKTLAKVANHLAKKDTNHQGVMVLDTPLKQEAALLQTPIADIWGIGRKYAVKMHQHQLYTAADLVNRSPNWIREHLGGVVGLRLVKELQGHACQELKVAEPEKKSIACTRSFSAYITSQEELGEAVATYMARAAEKLRRQGSAANVVSVFIRTNKFSVHAKQHHVATQMVLPVASCDTGELTRYALACLQNIYQPTFLYKKAGVVLYGIVPAGQTQTNIFDTTDRAKSNKLMQALDKLNLKLGKNEWGTSMVGYAAAGTEKNWKMNLTRMSDRFTTHWPEILKVRI